MVKNNGFALLLNKFNFHNGYMKNQLQPNPWHKKVTFLEKVIT